MAARSDEFEEREDDDRDEPVASDVEEDSDDSEMAPCPFCGKAVYEGADVCPHCRNFVSIEELTGRKPWWVVVAAIVLLVAVLLWVVCYV